jgi:hypothetical protein
MIESLLTKWMSLGRLGGVVMIGAGGVFGAMFVLETRTLGHGHVALLGLAGCFLVVGILRLVFRTAEERMDDLLGDEPDAVYDAVDAAWAASQSLPFFVCTDCKIDSGNGVVCPSCLAGGSCLEARTEADRPLVVAVLG